VFTGLVLGLGTVTDRRPSVAGQVLAITADFPLDDPLEGESIACNGACLTARNINGASFLADVSPETLDKTTLGRLARGSRINLERALRLGDRFGGHMVSGHVDCVGRVEDRVRQGEYTLFTFSIAAEQTRYVVGKGSIAINGVSLTVNSCQADRLMVSIIPHTLAETNLGLLRKGDGVNIEVDIIGKYVERLLAPQHSAAAVKLSGIDSAFLAEHGFLK
jgi:riboflavin synthase